MLGFHTLHFLRAIVPEGHRWTHICSPMITLRPVLRRHSNILQRDTGLCLFPHPRHLKFLLTSREQLSVSATIACPLVPPDLSNLLERRASEAMAKQDTRFIKTLGTVTGRGGVCPSVRQWGE
jgi:hypothetical protein